MTSAHRPTWNAAVASGTNPSGGCFVAQTTKVANRDAANFLSLKVRQPGQGLVEERGSRRELREELELKEQKAREERLGTGGKRTAEETGASKKQDKAEKDKKAQARLKAVEDNPFPEDADEEVASNSGSSKSDDEDEDEDTEELMRELAKIKKEREAEEEAQKALKAKQDERSRRDEVMRGNPLLQAAGDSDLSLKRKWDDDTVFKNQARTAPKQKQRFINDAVRSDFHKKFLNKYVWMDGIAH